MGKASRLAYAGVGHAGSALLLCAPAPVDKLVLKAASWWKAENCTRPPLAPDRPASAAASTIGCLMSLRLGYNRAGDALSAPLLCAPAPQDTLLVEGRIVVGGGELCTLARGSVIARHRRLAAVLVI